MGLFNRFQRFPFPLNYISHHHFYLLGIAITLAGLSWSNFLMSLGQIVLICNWVLEADFKNKWQKLKTRPVILVLIGLFLFHLIGLLWTEDFKYGTHDLRIKLPLLLLPIVVGTSPALSQREWRALIAVYLSSCFIISLASLYKLMGLGEEVIYDKRELSILISHIRYGLNLCLAVILALHLYLNSRSIIKFSLLLLAAWFTACLIWYELSTGLLCLLFCGFFSLIYFALRRKVKTELKLATLIILSGFIFFCLYALLTIREDYFKEVPLSFNQEEFILNSPNGNPYYFDYDSELKEHGVYIWRFVATEELKEAWNDRSSIPADSLDYKGQKVFNTLVRFLSSKGLKKDSLGLAQLTQDEIRAIEKGIPDPYFLNHNPIQNRIYKTFYEFENYKIHDQMDGFSLVMRLEYWKNSWRIIKQNPWFGVGTGDVKQAIARQYEIDESPLSEDFRKRTHNQYLTIWLSLGVIALLYFLFSLIYPLVQINSKNRFLFMLFTVLIALSYLSEDTLETQAGVSFVALFTCLLLFARPNSK